MGIPIHILFYLWIYFFVSWNEIVKLKKFVIFLFKKMMKFSKFNNLENFRNLDKLSNTLNVKVIKKKNNRK